MIISSLEGKRLSKEDPSTGLLWRPSQPNVSVNKSKDKDQYKWVYTPDKTTFNSPRGRYSNLSTRLKWGGKHKQRSGEWRKEGKANNKLVTTIPGGKNSVLKKKNIWKKCVRSCALNKYISHHCDSIPKMPERTT